MTKTISVENATKQLPHIVEKLRKGTYVVLQKNGLPVAGIVDASDMEDFLELRDPSLNKQITKGYKEFNKGKATSGRTFLQSLQQKNK
jgi:antitoxin (DNA-binding transcriptional repressor) of toxin-antitoxin stability system